MTAARNSQDDTQRWTQWVCVHGSAVRGYLLAMVRRPDLADELAQETFFRAWQARERYREEGTARAYLIRIADRLVCDRARKLGHEVQMNDQQWKQVEPPSRACGPELRAIQKEACRELAAAMKCLSPAQRRVLLLRFYGDLSFAEIAEAMNCPLGTALSHCHRGLQALRQQLVESEQ
jgi:RNA polymerase sigma-70 factor, ECF subfamily